MKQWIALAFFALLLGAWASAFELPEEFGDTSIASLPDAIEWTEWSQMQQSIPSSITFNGSPKQLMVETLESLQSIPSPPPTQGAKTSGASTYTSLLNDVNQSIQSYYNDETHVKQNRVFDYDVNAIQKVWWLESQFPGNAVIFEQLYLVEQKISFAALQTSNTAFNDAGKERSAIKLKSSAKQSYNKKIKKSFQSLDRTNYFYSSGAYYQSLLTAKSSWDSTQQALQLLDKKSDPTIEWNVKKTIRLEENATIQGSIHDVFWYALKDASVQTENGLVKVSLQPDRNQSKAIFALDTKLTQSINVFTITQSDDYKNSSTKSVSIAFDDDGLPQWFEEQVLKTNPLKKDSDGNGIDDGQEDFDHDALGNIQEFVLELNANNSDFDGDGLTDGFEVQSSETNPKISDSDTIGQLDSQIDSDGDGLTNLQEQNAKTNALNSDSDSDGLTDYNELNQYQSNPNSTDSDNDGLLDDSEIKLGTNIMQADSDQDGILDGTEQFQQTVSTNNFSITAQAMGDLEKKSSLLLNEMAPQAFQAPFVLKTESFFSSEPFTAQQVTFHYDPTQLNGVSENDLKIVYFDSNHNSIGLLENQSIDTVNHTITGTVPSSATNAKIKLGRTISTNSSTGLESNAQFFALSIGPSMAEYNAWKSAWKKPTMVFKPGDNVRAKALVKNKGGSGSGPTNVKFYRNGNESDAIGTASLPSLNAGSSYSVSITWSVSSNTQQVCAKADSDNVVVESVEGNNSDCEDFSNFLDSDLDGLADGEEIAGLRVAFSGKAIRTDPLKADTDGDGLSDGAEMGDLSYDGINQTYFKIWATLNGVDNSLYDGVHYAAFTDPTLRDSDGDGTNDFDEIARGSTPWLWETQSVTEFAWGFFLGEFQYSDPQHGNIPFMAGWLASGFLVFGDIRDAIHSASSLDGLSFGLNVIAILPIIGDAGSVAAKVGKFVGKHGDELMDAIRVIVKSGRLDNPKIFIVTDEAYKAATGVSSITSELKNAYKFRSDEDLVKLMQKFRLDSLKQFESEFKQVPGYSKVFGEIGSGTDGAAHVAELVTSGKTISTQYGSTFTLEKNNIAWLEKFESSANTDFDIVLKDGTLIEAKSGADVTKMQLGSEEFNRLERQLTKYSDYQIQNPIGGQVKPTVLVSKNPLSNDVVSMIGQLRAAGRNIHWVVVP